MDYQLTVSKYGSTSRIYSIFQQLERIINLFFFSSKTDNESSELSGIDVVLEQQEKQQKLSPLPITYDQTGMCEHFCKQFMDPFCNVRS